MMLPCVAPNNASKLADVTAIEVFAHDGLAAAPFDCNICPAVPGASTVHTVALRYKISPCVLTMLSSEKPVVLVHDGLAPAPPEVKNCPFVPGASTVHTVALRYKISPCVLPKVSRLVELLAHAGFAAAPPEVKICPADPGASTCHADAPR